MLPGKLPLDLLSRLLDDIEVRDPRVFLGAKAGEDAALIDFGDRYLVAKTDPITFATDMMASYLVQVNANDIAVTGGTPRWFLATLLLPEGVTESEVESLFGQLNRACEAANVTLVGGHTEITYDLPRPIAFGVMLGEAPKDGVTLTSGARVGDSVVLTKGIAIEGASILAREAADALRERGVDVATLRRARGLLQRPGVSVVREAAIARQTVDVHAMHDPTEGGLSGGLVEMAAAAGVGMRIDADAVPILPECAAICRALALDPMGLIASGALLAALPPGDAPTLRRALALEGIPLAEIGEVTEPALGLRLIVEGREGPFPTFPRDELARWFSDTG